MIDVQTNSITASFGRKPWVNTLLYYSFNNDTASISYDWSWNNYNWTWNNNSWTYQPLTRWKCVELTWNQSKYMTIPNSIPFPTVNFTISFRVNFTQNSTNYSKSIFSKHANSWTNSYLYINEFQWKIRCDIPRRLGDCFISNNTLNDWNRHHISMIKNWTSYKMYVDNVLNSNKTSSTYPQQSTSVQPYFWRNNASWNDWFAWLVDEFIVETVARSEADNTSYFNKEKRNYWFN